MANRYFIRFKGRVLGPMTQDKVTDLVQRGQVTRMHEISPDGIQWRKAELFEEFYPKQVVRQTATDAGAATQFDKSDELKLSSAGLGNEQVSANLVKWFAYIDGSQVGPVDESTAKQWVSLGKLLPDSLIWKEGMPEWLAASLVRPQWFSGISPNNQSSLTSSQHQPSVGGGFVEEIIVELRRRNGWVYLLGIVSTLILASHVVGSIFLLIKELAAPADSGGQAIWNVAASILLLAVGVIGLIASLRLVQYANIVGAMKYAPTGENARESARILSRCWHFAGMFVLANLSLIALVVLLSYTAGIRAFYLLGR